VGSVILGALVSGGVQAALARFDRRLDARSSARLLYMRLHEAHLAIEELRPRRDWDKMITDWGSFGVAWDKHSESLARALKTKDFETVSAAFSGLASLARAKDRDAQRTPPPPFGVPDENLALWAANAEVARQIVYGASFTRWEKWRGEDSAGG